MKTWENALLEELEIKDTMFGGKLSETVDMQWTDTDKNQTYRAYDKENALS